MKTNKWHNTEERNWLKKWKAYIHIFTRGITKEIFKRKDNIMSKERNSSQHNLVYNGSTARSTENLPRVAI